MTYHISYIDDVDIVVLRYDAPVNISEHFDGRKETIELCEEKGTKKVLVVLNYMASEDSSDLNDFMVFGKSLDKKQSKEVKFFVVLPKDRQAQNDIYFPIYLLKKNGVSVKTFFTCYEAIEYLL
jgi:hypothetical protein